MNPVSVFRSMQEELSRTYNLPFPATLCIRGLFSLHWIWWAFRKREMVKSENIIPAGIGTTLDLGLKLTPSVVEKSVRAIAKIILIVTRIDESVQAMGSLGQAFNQLKNAAINNYSPVSRPQWVKHSGSVFVSATTANRWNSLGRDFKNYILHIYQSILKVFTKIFKLSMLLISVYHAFIFSYDAVPELAINGMYWYKRIRHNKEYIITKLEEYRFTIQKVFEALQQPSSATDDLIDKSKTMLDFTVKSIESAEQMDESKKRALKKFTRIKSKLLGKELWQTPPHTPFVLKKKPDINW